MNDDIERGCLLPVGQCGVTFVLLALLTYGAARWQGWNSPGWIALVTGAAGALLVWASGVLAWRRDVYGVEEPYHPTPSPALQVQNVRVELAQETDGARRLNLIDLPASADQLAALAHGLLTGASLSESTWTGGRGLFTRAEFSQLRAELLRRKLAAWNSPGTPARGASLTPSGRAVMRQFAMLTEGDPTTPARDDTRTARL